MSGRRALGAAAAAALLASSALGAPQEAAKVQAERAQALMDRLYADHGNAGLLRESEALLGECLAAGNYRTAEFLAGQIVYHRPDRLQDRHRYARILIAKGDRAQAEKDLREALRERPSDCAAYDLLAGLLADDGRFEGAVAVHEAHLKEHAGDAGALYAVADLTLRDLRHLDAARAAVDRMRNAATAPGVPERTARWLALSADGLDRDREAMARDRVAILAAEGRVDRLLWVSLAAALAALAGAFGLTRRRA